MLINSSIGLHQILVPARRIFSLRFSVQDLELRHVNSPLQQVGSSSLTGVEPRPPAMGVQSVSHWTPREVYDSQIPFKF